MPGTLNIKPRHAHAIGIDITDGSLELANTIRDGNTISLREHVRLLLPPEVIVNGVIRDQAALHEYIGELLAQARIHAHQISVVTALPDAQIIMRSFMVPDGRGYSYEQLSQIARHHVRQSNIELNAPRILWQAIPWRGRDIEMNVYLTDAAYIDQWLKFFARSGLRLVVLEMESLALARSLRQRLTSDETFGIIDFGYRHTNIALFDRHGLRYSHIFKPGGNDITMSIADALGCTPEEAERHKLLSDSDEVRQIVYRELSGVVESIGQALNQNPTPQSMIITGGGANIPGISNWCEKQLSLRARLGHIWLHDTSSRGQKIADTQLDVDQQQLYAGAIGLALRGLDNLTLARGINFLK